VDDCSLDDSYKIGFLAFRLQTRVRDRASDRDRVRLSLGFKVVIISRYAQESVLSIDRINNL